MKTFVNSSRVTMGPHSLPWDNVENTVANLGHIISVAFN